MVTSNSSLVVLHICSVLVFVCSLGLCVNVCSASSSSSSSEKMINKFKAPNESTPRELVLEWIEKDEALGRYIAKHVPAVLEHNGDAAFDDHLKGVQAILRNWGAPDYLCDAGLFHSIYGTEGFQGFALPLSERESVRDLIGAPAEKLSWTFCMIDRWSMDQHLLEWKREDPLKESYTLLSRPELGRFPMQLSTLEWIDFVELNLADFLEQVEGAATKENPYFLWKKGESYTHRRIAYQRMVQFLVYVREDRLKEKVTQSYDEVYSTEGEETRHLVQMRTPPYTDAAAKAWDASEVQEKIYP
eukprot:CAMPEP_0197827050 /NCGR_PEP_ID=MMETSP1437-20131217/3930_1 /TAXON_ID=49252 ORGANISM="Eucampia antarctica, Strain CCMP1452" /NCGR_SAMPLE_ID=MMETSP1437 /ASSEMBLY_ACC=CAM_ASM_001096 /LENGTH=301 /DNA_ID=CAMNT_0043427765 /DNA_START=56 /DNA_END=962 /DNA_ORIENTATION=-